jgi:hypothetical protein
MCIPFISKDYKSYTNEQLLGRLADKDITDAERKELKKEILDNRHITAEQVLDTLTHSEIFETDFPYGPGKSFCVFIKNFFLDKFYEIVSNHLRKTSRKKDRYLSRLESASDGQEIFKYFLLVNVSMLDSYFAQTRLQAQSVFRLCKRLSYGAFVVILAGVGLAIVNASNNASIKPPALATLAGLLTHFISSIALYFYTKILQQFNLSEDKLVIEQQVAISFMANSNIRTQKIKEDNQAEISKLLEAVWKQSLYNRRL